MANKIVLTEREVKEIQHALYYAENLNHGSPGHMSLVLIAKLAEFAGFEIDDYAGVRFPTEISIEIIPDRPAVSKPEKKEEE